MEYMECFSPMVTTSLTHLQSTGPTRNNHRPSTVGRRLPHTFRRPRGRGEATKTINLSEDIFAGMDFTLRGPRGPDPVGRSSVRCGVVWETVVENGVENGRVPWSWFVNGC